MNRYCHAQSLFHSNWKIKYWQENIFNSLTCILMACHHFGPYLFSHGLRVGHHGAKEPVPLQPPVQPRPVIVTVTLTTSKGNLNQKQHNTVNKRGQGNTYLCGGDTMAPACCTACQWGHMPCPQHRNRRLSELRSCHAHFSYHDGCSA